MKNSLFILLSSLIASCSTISKKENHHQITVYHTTKTPTIDGKALEPCWDISSWHGLNQNWSDNSYSSNDFNGRYKILWNKEALYILIEITDDVLYAPYKNPLKLWWNNDSLQLFIDEDNSGGLHQYNHNAFVYNIGLHGQSLDLDTNKKPSFFNHVTSKRTTVNTLSTWEIKVNLYEENFKQIPNYSPKQLYKNKKIGFSIAYCDNDKSWERENYIGSVFVPEENKNQGWINADVFGTLVLKEL